jgi:WD40 repeat protein
MKRTILVLAAALAAGPAVCAQVESSAKVSAPSYVDDFNEDAVFSEGPIRRGKANGVYYFEPIEKSGQYSWWLQPIPEAVVEVTGRVKEGSGPECGWIVNLAQEGKRTHGVKVVVFGNGRMWIGPSMYDADKSAGPEFQEIADPTINPAGQWNTLRVVVRGNVLGIHMNGKEILEPMELSFRIGSGRVALGVNAAGKNSQGRAEITRLAIWPTTDLWALPAVRGRPQDRATPPVARPAKPERPQDHAPPPKTNDAPKAPPLVRKMIEGGPVLTSSVPMARPMAVAFSPDGRQIAIGGLETTGSAPIDGIVALIDVETGQQQAPLRHSGTLKEKNRSSGSTNSVRDLAYSPDGKSLAVAADLGLKIWNPSEGVEMATPVGYSLHKPSGGGVESTTFSPDGKFLAASFGGGGIKGGLWDATIFAKLREIDAGVSDFAFSSDNELILSAEGGNRVHAWRVADGRQVGEVHAHMGPLHGVAINRAGNLVAAVGQGGEKLWTIDSGTGGDWRFGNEVRLRGQTSAVRDVAFSPDDRLLVTGTRHGTVVLYDVETHAVVGSLWDGGPFAFSPDGRSLAVAEIVRGQREPGTQFSIWKVSDVLDADRLAEQAREAARKLVRMAESGQPDYNLQPRFLAVLSGPQAHAAAPALMAALARPEIKQKQLIAMALGRMAAASPDAVVALAKAVRDDTSVDTRVAAAFALAMTTPQAGAAAVPALSDALLKDESPEVKRMAARALDHLNPAALGAVAEKLRAQGPVTDKVEKRGGKLIYQGRPLEEWISKLSKSFIPNEIFGRPSADEPLAAIRAIGADAVPELLNAIKGQDWALRHAGVAGLKALGPETAARAGVNEAEFQKLIETDAGN